ncbi:hypothetical protein GCM10017566_18480 [Amycolatopsis bartoniae]|uniref:Class F sortase n=1 Tax=Amycolatopsis bartoniae TaxID=941986 RepID=A0A8H9IS80_9PSEU|nr:hypothetical protein GCM10017566_18480 [Amycolatopsis bartoniae]
MAAAAVLLAVSTGGVLLSPPTAAVAGTPHALPVAPAPAVIQQTQQATASPPSPVTTAPPPASSVAPAPAVATTPAQAPGTVRLPSGSTARLVRQEVVGGVLPVPRSLNDAAWWGADLDAPRGATVFAGHVNWAGRTGPFAELWTARIGQEVTVVAPDGRLLRYRVSQLISLQKDELPHRAVELFGQTGAHRLVLVTCGGEWVGGAQGYAENRVAIADPA